ncbi:MAG: hypothetical protein PSX36_10840 [bacterium]|nr:hypothetical protein [bacterium]
MISFRGIELNLVVKKIAVLIFCFSLMRGSACQCPPSDLSLKECDKYEIIFKGKVSAVKSCGSAFGEAIFEVEELYKGNATKNFKVLFECVGECSGNFNVGEEWIIYSRYKQIDNAKMDWCSRSRKFFRNQNEDFYTVNYGNDYDDEAKFLKEKLGLHRFLSDNKYEMGGRNTRPNFNQMVIILLVSLGALVLFYYLFNKFFK